MSSSKEAKRSKLSTNQYLQRKQSRFSPQRGEKEKHPSQSSYNSHCQDTAREAAAVERRNQGKTRT